MKQTLLLCSLAALALASCSNDEEVRGMGNAISFRPSVENATRGASYAAGPNTLPDFKVTCFKQNDANPYFADKLFTKDANNIYRSEQNYYYPTDNNGGLDFYCWAPKEVSMNATSFTIEDFEVAATIADQQDLVMAVKKSVTNADRVSGTSLNFLHALSQIEVQAKSGNPNYTYTVYGVKISKVKGKGSLYFGDTMFDTSNTYGCIEPNWWTADATAEAQSYEVTYANPVTLNATAQSVMGKNARGASDNALLLPQQLTAWESQWTPNAPDTNPNGNTYLAVKINIVKNDANGNPTSEVLFPENENGMIGPTDSEWAAVGIGTNWVPSNRYVYVLDFTKGAGHREPADPDMPDPHGGEEILGGAIRFTVNVSEWMDGGTTQQSMKVDN